MEATDRRIAIFVFVSLILLLGSPTSQPSKGVQPIRATEVEASVDHTARGWTEVTTTTHPQAVAGSMMTYSPDDNRFILFGGSDGEALNQTWSLDPNTGAWTQLHPPLSPHARADAMLAYDSRAAALVLFGGWYETPDGSYHRLADTWVFFVTNATWVQRNPGVSPSPRSDAAVAYDDTEGVTLIFGGFDGVNYLGDTWYYSFHSDTWSPRPSPLMPSARADGRMTYDPQHKSFFLFSGNDYSDANFNFHHLADMWRYTWSGNVWTQIHPDLLPMPRDYAVFATDLAFGELLLTGGYGNRTILRDTWAFNTTDLVWRDVTTVSGPLPRMAAVGGYDSEDDLLAVYGGGVRNLALTDTWFFRYPPPLLGNIFVSTADPTVGQPVAFRSEIEGGSGSYVKFSWDFGDGQFGSGPVITHAFGGPGLYQVQLQLKDSRGNQLVSSLRVAVGLLMPFWMNFALLVLGISLILIATFALVRGRRKSRSLPPEHQLDEALSELR